MLRHTRIALLAPLLVLVAALTSAVPAPAQIFPALSGRVVDQAGMLSRSTRTELTGRLAALEAENTDQLVVATVSSLDGLSIEDYANRLFRHWQLGQKDKNNGALLLVAPNERKVRIEVGYGLEGTLTDAVSKLIISESIIPHFAAKDMPAGVVQGVDDLISVLTGDTAAWQRRAATAAPHATANPNVHVVNLPPVIGYVLLVLIYAGGALLFGFMAYIIGFGIFSTVISLLVAIHVLPDRKHRRGRYAWVTAVERASSSSGSSSSSSSSDSFSGGGGSSGGGGASGSW